jgi:hypothetical protein
VNTEENEVKLSLDWYWIAGRRPDYRQRKEGTSGLGACIVSAAGPAHANAKAKGLGIHPGGEFKIWRLHGPPPEKFRERKLSQEEAREADRAILEMRA